MNVLKTTGMHTLKKMNFMVCELYLKKAVIKTKVDIISLYLVIYYEHFSNIPNNYSSVIFLFSVIKVMHIHSKKKLNNADERTEESEVFLPLPHFNTFRVPA